MGSNGDQMGSGGKVSGRQVFKIKLGSKTQGQWTYKSGGKFKTIA